jgi:hypothetical protein
VDGGDGFDESGAEDVVAKVGSESFDMVSSLVVVSMRRSSGDWVRSRKRWFVNGRGRVNGSNPLPTDARTWVTAMNGSVRWQRTQVRVNGSAPWPAPRAVGAPHDQFVVA